MALPPGTSYSTWETRNQETGVNQQYEATKVEQGIWAMGPEEPEMQTSSLSRYLSHKVQRSPDTKQSPSHLAGHCEATSRPNKQEEEKKQGVEAGSPGRWGTGIRALKHADPLTQQQPMGN